MNKINRYRVEIGPTGKADVASVSPYAPGFGDDPRIIVYGYLMQKVDADLAEEVVDMLNMAFNAGREYAEWW